MNKKELIKVVSAKCGTSQNTTAKVVNAFIETVGETLAKDENIVLMGLGTFFVRERAERLGYDIQTKGSVQIPSKRVVRFRVSEKMEL